MDLRESLHTADSSEYCLKLLLRKIFLCWIFLLIPFLFNNMSANRWYRRYPVGVLFPRQSIMCLWCVFNAVCSSAHLPKCALGERECVCECVSMQPSQVGAHLCRDTPWSPESLDPLFTIQTSFTLMKKWGEGPAGWVYHLWKEFTWKSWCCDG